MEYLFVDSLTINNSIMRTSRFNSDNLDEIVFEHRNKAYGAYELRKTYHTRVIKSFLSTMTLIALAFGITVFVQRIFTKEVLTNVVMEDQKIDVTKIFTLDNAKKIEVQQSPKPPVQRATADAPFQVTRDSLIPEIKKDTLIQLVVEPAAGNGGSNVSNDPVTDPSSSAGGTGTATIASADPYTILSVDKAPEFHGGENALIDYLQKHIRVTGEARSEHVNGRVYASFIINSKGEVEGIKILHSLGYGLDDEVVRVLHTMPKWEPGYYHGIAVSTILNIPVVFNIQ